MPDSLGSGVDSTFYNDFDIDRYETVIAAAINYEINIIFCQSGFKNSEIKQAVIFVKENNISELLYALNKDKINYTIIPDYNNSKAIIDSIRNIISSTKIAVNTTEIDEANS